MGEQHASVWDKTYSLVKRRYFACFIGQHKRIGALLPLIGALIIGQTLIFRMFNWSTHILALCSRMAT